MLDKICRFLARSDLFFYLLLWLMILLVTGTIAQQSQGLYYAQQTYFSSYFLVFNLIPVPGTYTVLAIIFFSLLAKLYLDNWSIKKLGTLITHISGLLLLLGGFLTAHFSTEGYIELAHSEIKDYVSSYREVALKISNNERTSIVKINPDNFNLANKTIHFGNYTFQITNYCQHCTIVKNSLKKLPKAKDNEELKTIIGLNIFQKNKQINNSPIYLSKNSASYNLGKLTLALESKRSYLPFRIKLRKFQPTTYPGTDIAQSFESEVTIVENNKNIYDGVISMNNPLRYKGYTFYQSSYISQENTDNYITVLAVVYNLGQNFPYIASILLAIGIFIHLLQRRMPNN
jgi:hypothetical protein